MKVRSMLLAGACSVACTLSAAPKVLVYMLDGARADVMEATNTPAWKMLKENRWADGYKTAWSVTAQNEPFVLPASAPNHATIATGRFAKNHKVVNNGEPVANFRQEATPTFLERIGRKNPEARTVQAFSWRPDLKLIAQSGNCSIVCGNDVNNNLVLVEMLKRPNDISALMVFDDAPDAGGHNTGFYPYGEQYMPRVTDAMQRFGNLLAAIKAQPTFAQDDWLIVLCSDHGGNNTRHNLSGGQCNTVPLLYCGKNIPAGRMDGRPSNLGIAANVLRHMGLASETAELDDRGEIRIAAPTEQSVTDGMVYNLAVSGGSIANRAPGNAGFTPHGSISVGDNSFSTGSDGYVTLNALKNRANGPMTFAITVRSDLSKVSGDPVIFGNKDWNNGGNPGMALLTRKGRFIFNSACVNAPRNYIVTSPKRMDLWDIVPDAEGRNMSMVAVSVDPAGLVTVFQEYANGRQYWFCADAKGINTSSALDWNIGQDGTGKYKCRQPIEVKNFRFWNRALSLDELRKLGME